MLQTQCYERLQAHLNRFNDCGRNVPATLQRRKYVTFLRCHRNTADIASFATFPFCALCYPLAIHFRLMIGASKLATPKAVMVSRNLTHRAVDEMTEDLQIQYDSKKESCHVNGIQFMKDQV